MSSTTPESAIIAAGVGATLLLFRVSLDWIVFSSTRRDDPKRNKSGSTDAGTEPNGGRSSFFNRMSLFRSTNGQRSSLISLFNGRSSVARPPFAPEKSDKSNGLGQDNVPEVDLEGQPDKDEAEEEDIFIVTPFQRIIPPISLVVHTLLFVYFLTACIMSAKPHSAHIAFTNAAYNALPLGCTAAASFFNVMYNIQDCHRKRFSHVQRMFYTMGALILVLGDVILLASTALTSPTVVDYITLAALCVNVIWTLLECKLYPYRQLKSKEGKKATLSRKALLTILKPYFWPDATASSAILNRIRALTTWLCVASSKVCSLLAPILIGKASTALSQGQFYTCIKYAVLYSSAQFASSFFREAQSLVYLKVAQAAFVQLSEVSFHHLHSLSLDWHLRKKLGEVIRSMDRGIQACDTLMKYLFLWLMPAIAECLLVVIIFATYFNYFALSVAVFFFVFVYIIMTIVITLWRKRFRKAVAKSDNAWHDVCTDSLVNFETVKYFTAEQFEMDRFGKAVETFQSGSVHVQASLSVLNLVQGLLLQACLATSLTLATMAIRSRMECCVDNGCSGFSDTECCAAISEDVCPGMQIGDFVSVLTYTIQLFTPLNFLGTVYNAVVMAMVDLANLSELLAENPDVTDSPTAKPLPKENFADPDAAVEFDNVVFEYPSAGGKQSLQGLSFKMKKGTVTALVGPSGAGKTTVSRLFFRFYDVNDGAVRVNGVDVRNVTQKSLREAIGVVPQATSLFNDTIRNNVLYGNRNATDEDLERVAKAAQLDTFISTLPEGWETLVGDRGLKLSGGEKQRVAIARCLLKDPPFLLLDEATSALDSVTENSVQEALDSLGKERTCLVIAHRLGTIRNADNIIVLDQGKVSEQGTHEELLALDGKYAQLWNMQLHSTRESSASLEQLER